jgi:hypothetical protein
VGAPLPDVAEHLVGGRVKRVFVQDAVHHRERVRAEQVHHQRAAEPADVVHAHRERLAAVQHLVDARLVGDELLDARRLREHPAHLPDDPHRRPAGGGVIADHRLQ